MDLGLRDRVALVAGSSRGIGRAIAASLAHEGCRVAVSGRERATVDETVAEIGQHLDPGRLMAIAADLSQKDMIERTLAVISAEWGPVEVLVANIGTGTARPGWELDDRDWERAFEANLHASRRLVEAALTAMLEQGRGSIIFIASIAGLESLNAPLTYSAAKAALISYAKNLSRLVARRGVRVNTVAPGNILFEGGSWARKVAERGDAVRRSIDSEVPAGRFGGVDEIADVVAFLASDRAAFVTGACLVADGGQTRSY
jgi:3-oxoacyl-[acyl-carrier protein] reductase